MSNFTRLASRLRESGKRVYGFGEKKTPRPFVSACDRFIYTEVFTQTPTAQAKHRTPKDLLQDMDLVKLLHSAIEAASDEGGWAHLGAVGTNVTKQAPDFDSRNYGYSKLSDLLAASTGPV